MDRDKEAKSANVTTSKKLGEMLVEDNFITAEQLDHALEHQYLLSRGRDFASNLKLVTNALPPGAHFTHIEIGTRRITVEGEADSAFTVISYVMALEAVGEFSEIRIAEIAANESAGVSFSIVITKLD